MLLGSFQHDRLQGFAFICAPRVTTKIFVLNIPANESQLQ